MSGSREADLALLTAAAEAAGEIAMRRRAGGFETWDKPGGAGPVTEADLEIDRMLRAELVGARPDYGWLSEETADEPEARRRAERVFVVDPIDGTRAYARGDEGFCHALAVVEAGRAVAAVVHLPARGETYAAAEGGGATKDGAPIRPSTRERLEGAAVLATAAGMKPERWPGGAPPVERHFRNALAWRVCLVAEGAFDASVSLGPVWEWDAASAALIAAEAGAHVADARGLAPEFNVLDPRLQGLIAAAPGIAAPILARLQPRRGVHPAN
jgi:myo-inositol-1(or 4)-monophosphatase